jgi:hypothetical protein
MCNPEPTDLYRDDVTNSAVAEQAQSTEPSVTSAAAPLSAAELAPGTVDVTPNVATEQANSTQPAVTSPAAPLSVAERKRRQRERERNAQALLYERSDWQLFCDISTLPQKAGCQPGEIVSIALKELVDNALDHCPDGDVTLRRDCDWWVVEDTGPGMDPERVPALFCVNRPLLSSKLRRLPLRGMLGNGLRAVMGAVAATKGALVVETRGHRLELEIDCATGLTRVLSDTDVPIRVGTVVRIRLRDFLDGTDREARIALFVARHGRAYAGPSSPHWYGPRDLLRLFRHHGTPQSPMYAATWASQSPMSGSPGR